MKSVTQQVEIGASTAAVWAVLEDVRLLPELSASTVEVEAPARLSETGQTFTQTVEFAGRRFTSTWTVEQIEPQQLLVIEGSVLPGTHSRMTESLASISETCTRFELTMDYRLPFGPLGRLAGRLGAERRAVAEAADVVEGVRRMVTERSESK